MKKIVNVLPIALVIIWTKAAEAFCPVCAVAAGAGVGVARELGVDDSIVGLWLGGLTVALIGWTFDWLTKKNWRFKYDSLLVSGLFYVLTLVPLYYMKVLGAPLKMFGNWPIDKIVLGTILGSLLFWWAGEWYQDLKRKHNNKAYFPYQKVVMPVGSLLIASGLFYFLTK